jgi:hypothetical protein
MPFPSLTLPVSCLDSGLSEISKNHFFVKIFENQKIKHTSIQLSVIYYTFIERKSKV